MITDIEAAWAAGFVDGEGYIGIQEKLNRNRYRKDPALFKGVPTPYVRKPTYKLSIQVSQRNREPLDKLAHLFGGRIGFHGRSTKKEIVYWDWSLSSEKAGAALEVMFPHFVNKRHVAALAIEFQRWYSATMYAVRIGQSMSEERRAKAGEYFLEVQKINRTYRDVSDRSVKKLIPRKKGKEVTTILRSA